MQGQAQNENDNDVVLKVEGLRTSFYTREGIVRAVDNVSFDIKRNTVHCLVGENGAGKSTLNKILAGSYLPDEGQIYLRGKQVQFRNHKSF